MNRQQLMARWQVLLTRIDALSLRERLFLFVSVLACLLAVADALWLSPLQARNKQLRQRTQAQEMELLKLRGELKALPAGGGPAQVMRAELEQVKAELAGVSEAINRLPAALLQGTPLAQALAHFLRRHPGLTLVHTATLPAPTRADLPAGTSVLARQGLALTVAGSYPELMRYVQTLEREMPALRWGEMRLVNEKQATELTLQVYLVEAAP